MDAYPIQAIPAHITENDDGGGEAQSLSAVRTALLLPNAPRSKPDIVIAMAEHVGCDRRHAEMLIDRLVACGDLDQSADGAIRPVNPSGDLKPDMNF